jgi:hypothetical protein
MINTTGDWATDTAREAASTLREFLFPNIPEKQAVTAKTTGKRLKRHVDEPVPHRGGSLTLKASWDTHRLVFNFYVLYRRST